MVARLSFFVLLCLKLQNKTKMKKLFFLLIILLASCAPKQESQQVAKAATMTQMRFHCDSDTTVINDLLKKGHDSGLNDANQLIEFYARQLLGTPYVAHTLEADKEVLTINIHTKRRLTIGRHLHPTN